jgi:hypothetical protein
LVAEEWFFTVKPQCPASRAVVLLQARATGFHPTAESSKFPVMFHSPCQSF